MVFDIMVEVDELLHMWHMLGYLTHDMFFYVNWSPWYAYYVIANGVGHRGMLTWVFTSLYIIYAALLLLVANQFKYKDVGGCTEW